MTLILKLDLDMAKMDLQEDVFEACTLQRY